MIISYKHRQPFTELPSEPDLNDTYYLLPDDTTPEHIAKAWTAADGCGYWFAKLLGAIEIIYEPGRVHVNETLYDHGHPDEHMTLFEFGIKLARRAILARTYSAPEGV